MGARFNQRWLILLMRWSKTLSRITWKKALKIMLFRWMTTYSWTTLVNITKCTTWAKSAAIIQQVGAQVIHKGLV